MNLSAYIGQSGLAATLTWAFYDDTETIIGSFVGTNIQEAQNGWYSLDTSVSIPSNAVSIRWVDTSGTGLVAIEYFEEGRIADAVWKSSVLTLWGDDTFGDQIASVFATELNNILSRLPSALVGGRMDSSVGAMAADTLTSSALATSAVTEIANAVAAATGGTGAYSITVTVTDGTDPLPTALVRVTQGVTSIVLTTDASGQATFALDAATYDVAVTKSGYSFTPTTRTVTGNETGTLTNDLEMTAIVFSSVPSSPDKCIIYGYLVLSQTGGPAVNKKVVAKRTPKGRAYSNGFIVGEETMATTDGNGYFELEVTRNDAIEPAGSQYRIICTDASIDTTQSLNAANFDLSSIL